MFVEGVVCVNICIYEHQKVFKLSHLSMRKPVSAWRDSNVWPSAISVRISLPSRFSNTAFSVMTMLATLLPVRGNQHLSISFSRAFPVIFSALCCITTITFDPLLTRSIAPPIPFAILPGIIQFAMSPLWLTCRAPSMVMSRWPPRMMEKDSEEEK